MMKLSGANNRGRYRFAVSILFSVIVVIVAGTFLYFPQIYSSLFAAVARPFWRVQFAVNSGVLKTEEILIMENETLKRTIYEQNLNQATVRELELENLELKDLLGRASTTDGILAAVLVKPPLAPYDELVIDLGYDFIHSTTSRVYAPGHVLIGKISEISGQVSKVRLFTSPGQKVEVEIGPKHYPVTAIGRGGGQYEAQLPRSALVLEGDIANTSYLGDRFFAKVVSVIDDPASPFVKILLASPVNIYQLRWVMVEN